MGRQQRRGRDLHGILVFDKPAGITSNGALQQLKRLFDARKAGHTGSLDQPATGLLPICFGEATKLSGYLLDADKHYQARCRLGRVTTTGDAAGETLDEQMVPALSAGQIEAALARFRGPIMQTPPMHSALKHQGKRLHELARAGIEVERAPRPVTIHVLTLNEQGDTYLDIEVRCSKGTYIRTLAEEIGAVLGCGAHVESLRRLGAGPFVVGQMHAIEELQSLLETGGIAALDATLLPLDSALQQWPALYLTASLVQFLLQGQAVVVPKAPTSGLVRLYDSHQHFFAVGEVLDDGRIGPKRLLNIRH
ncbi:MAG: tRNA pseudouridine(55) synthase TruB [Gammaproteobacteria bacterium]